MTRGFVAGLTLALVSCGGGATTSPRTAPPARPPGPSDAPADDEVGPPELAQLVPAGKGWFCLSVRILGRPAANCFRTSFECERDRGQYLSMQRQARSSPMNMGYDPDPSACTAAAAATCLAYRSSGKTGLTCTPTEPECRELKQNVYPMSSDCSTLD